MRTAYGFKLFEMDTENNLYPLFIDNKTIVPVGQWVNAGIHPHKNFSVRPGFHLGEVCDAPWLKDANGNYKGRRKNWKRVWAECEYVAENNYDNIVSKLPKKCFTDKLPIDGYYKFKETGCQRIWIVCDKIKVIKILSEDERQNILSKMNYDETKAFAPYKISFEKRMKKKEV